MKKILLLFLFTTIASLALNAQQYFPMLDSANVWSFTGNVSPMAPLPNLPAGPCGYPQYISYHLYTEGDTILNSHGYKKLMSDDHFNLCLFGYLREDTSARKIYFQDVVDSPEVVLYNFSMAVGDSMTINFPYTQWAPYFPDGVYRLDSITNVSIRAGARRAFHLNCLSVSTPHTLTWIESVGNTGNVIYPYSMNDYGDYFMWAGGCHGFPYDFIEVMICFEHSEKVYFDTCTYQAASNDFCFNLLDSCNYWNICSTITSPESGIAFDISPNPACRILSVRSASPMNSISLFNVTGEKAMSFLLPALPGEAHAELDIHSLSPGIYFIEVRGNGKTGHSKFIKSSF
jgi:hypothetical protein